MVRSQITHEEPIIGSRNPPYWETGYEKLRLLPVVGFLRKDMSPKIKNIIGIFVAIVCLAATIYIVVLIYHEVRPKSYNEKYIDCLKLGSDNRAAACIKKISP